MKERVLVLGGGLAGLSAAVHLTRAGYAVTVLEKRPFSGGRTYSFSRDFWPHPIDNGPHVMLGSYADMLALLDIVGGLEHLSFTGGMRIPFLFAGGRSALLADKRRPAPLHLVSALLGFSPLHRRQRWRIARLFLTVARMREEDRLDRITAADWLSVRGQDSAILALFWRPLVLATLNEEPDRVSMLQLYRVLKLGFLQERRASQIVRIAKGLSFTVIQPCAAWLTDNGGEILYQRRALRVCPEAGSQKLTVMSNKGAVRGFDRVISTLPFAALLLLLETSRLATTADLSALKAFEGSAIVNLHFWYPGRLAEDAMSSLHDIHAQWLFAHASHAGMTHYTLVISSADSLIGRHGKSGLSEMLLRELATVLPEFDASLVQHTYMTVEKNATLVCGPDMEDKRPVPGEVAERFYVAGDWTRTGLPPTMESAVRSGRMAAEAVIRKGSITLPDSKTASDRRPQSEVR